MDQEEPQGMTPEAAKAFEVAAAKEKGRILNAVRNPQADMMTGYFITNKSELVVQAMTKLIVREEADKVESFITAQPRRFEALAEQGQTNALFDIVEIMGKSQQARILGATETGDDGAPKATVLQTLATAKGPGEPARFAALLRGLDSAQTTKLFSQPGAALCLASNGCGELLTELMSEMSAKQRQYIVNHAGDMARVVAAAGSEEFTALFRDCKFPKVRGPKLGL